MKKVLRMKEIRQIMSGGINHMKKFLTLATMLVMLFSVSLTADAAKSPKAEKVESKPVEVVLVVSPKTADNDIMLYGMGAAAAVCAAGAVVVKRKEMAI